MAIVDWFKTGRQPEKKSRVVASASLTDTAACSEVFAGLVRSSVEEAFQIPAVHLAVRTIANGVASMPLSLKTVEVDGDGREVKKPNATHPLSAMFSAGRVNPYCSVFSFIQMMTANAAMYNDAYAWIEREGATKRSKIKAIWPLEFGELKIMRDTPNDERDPHKLRYDLQMNGTVYRQNLRPYEILHLRGLNFGQTAQIGNKFTPLALAAKSIMLLKQMRETQIDLHSKSGTPQGALTFDTLLEEKSAKAIKETLEKRYGSGKRGGISVFDFAANFIPFAVNFKDSQLTESHDAEILEIARFFNVHPTKLYDTSRSMTGTNAERLSIDFLNDSLLPWIRAWEAALNMAFGLQEKGLSLEFDDSALLRVSKKDFGEYAAKMTGSGGHPAILTVDELRVQMGLNPLGGKYAQPVAGANEVNSDDRQINEQY